jgi:hypothetical protein
LLKYQ